jgi:hypothetical protein
LSNDEEEVVIKLEPVNSKHHTLEHEFGVYKKLGRGAGIPHVRWFGSENGFNAMAMDALGQSLDGLFIHCCFRFSTKTVVLLACQLVSCSVGYATMHDVTLMG